MSAVTPPDPTVIATRGQKYFEQERDKASATLATLLSSIPKKGEFPDDDSYLSAIRNHENQMQTAEKAKKGYEAMLRDMDPEQRKEHALEYLDRLEAKGVMSRFKTAGEALEGKRLYNAYRASKQKSHP